MSRPTYQEMIAEAEAEYFRRKKLVAEQAAVLRDLRMRAAVEGTELTGNNCSKLNELQAKGRVLRG